MKYLRKFGFVILSSCILFLCVCFSFYSINQSTIQHQKESLEKALRRGILECYALEGRYPESLDYLIDHYHIIYNEDDFDIQYEIFASNIMPTVTIIDKN